MWKSMSWSLQYALVVLTHMALVLCQNLRVKCLLQACMAARTLSTMSLAAMCQEHNVAAAFRFLFGHSPHFLQSFCCAKSGGDEL